MKNLKLVLKLAMDYFDCFFRKLLIVIVVASGFDKWSEVPFIQSGGLRSKYILKFFHLHWGQSDIVGSEHSFSSFRYPAEVLSNFTFFLLLQIPRFAFFCVFNSIFLIYCRSTTK